MILGLYNQSLLYRFRYAIDPVEKEEQRQRIARQTEEYLARGKKIHYFGNGERAEPDGVSQRKKKAG